MSKREPDSWKSQRNVFPLRATKILRLTTRSSDEQPYLLSNVWYFWSSNTHTRVNRSNKLNWTKSFQDIPRPSKTSWVAFLLSCCWERFAFNVWPAKKLKPISFCRCGWEHPKKPKKNIEASWHQHWSQGCGWPQKHFLRSLHEASWPKTLP